jgi:hypothetical protein
MLHPHIVPSKMVLAMLPSPPSPRCLQHQPRVCRACAGDMRSHLPPNLPTSFWVSMALSLTTLALAASLCCSTCSFLRCAACSNGQHTRAPRAECSSRVRAAARRWQGSAQQCWRCWCRLTARTRLQSACCALVAARGGSARCCTHRHCRRGGGFACRHGCCTDARTRCWRAVGR